VKLLRKALLDGCFLLDLDQRDLPSVFHQVVKYLVARGTVVATEADALEASLNQREQQMSTAIGNAVAVPHTYLDAVREPVTVLVRLAHALNLNAPDSVPVRFVFVLLGPSGAAAQHLDLLANIARLVANEEFRYDAGVAKTQIDLLAALDRFDLRTAPRPAQKKKKTDSLAYTGRLFGGLIQDVRRRIPHYASDFRDGLHSFCFSPAWHLLSRSAASWPS